MERSLEALWETVLANFQGKVSVGNFAAILKPTALLSLDDQIATIAAPSAMVVGMLQTRFAKEIKEILDKQTGKNNDLFFIIKTVHQAEPAKKKQKQTEEAPLFTERKPQQELRPVAGHLPRVRSDFTFTNFAVSSTNQLAFVSSQKVAENIGRAYNPLFIYGPVGVGKTHLMHAIANIVYQQDPIKKIIYITSEEFTNEVVEAIRNNDTHRMKKRFRSAYLLIIDDIQFIEGKEKVQEELFHTFNFLIDNGAQICLTSDRPPQEIKKLEARLSSRFAGGLTVDIGKPDLELKTAIIKKKAEKFGVELPIDVALFLAEQAEDTRSLEGLLIRVFTQLGSNEPTLEYVKQLVGAVTAEKKTVVHADDVINIVCQHFNIKSTQLKGPKRDAFLVTARQVCMYLLNTELKLTTVEVGNLLGGRDHTTIMYGVDKMRKLVENKAPVSVDILGISQAIRG